MRDQITDGDFDLLSDLGVRTVSKEKSATTPREQWILAGFEEIRRFVETHRRLPEPIAGRDIFERIYAVRLERMRLSEECRELLKEMDPDGLLETPLKKVAGVEETGPEDAEILSALGVEGGADDIRKLSHVRSREEIQAAEEIAQRTPCADFQIFKPLFEQVQKELESGVRRTLKFQDNAEINKGDFFILDGQKVCVAELGEKFINNYGRPDRRLRVIYDNDTESDLLLRSLQRALNRDKVSRRITKPGFGPLFSDEIDEEDRTDGFIYVLRSQSEHPLIAENRNVIHKIGVTGGSVKKRIGNAEKDPTCLLAKVEIVETYKLSNVNPARLEKLLHRFFADARLDLELKGRFGHDVEPKEWFLLPLSVIEETIRRLKDGSIGSCRYEPQEGRIVEC